MTSTQILLEKDLLDLAEANLQKIHLNAKELEFWNLVYQSLILKRQLLIQKHGAMGAQTEINQILNEEQEILKILFNLNQYQELSANFFNYFQTGSSLAQTTYSSLSKNPLLTDSAAPLCLEARLIQYHLIFSYQIYKHKNYTEAFKSLQEIIDLLEKKPPFLRLHLNSYLSAINDQISLLLHTQNWSSIPALLQKIRQTEDKLSLASGNLTFQKHLLYTYIQELQLWKAQEEYSTAEEKIRAIVKIIEQYPLVKDQYEAEFYLQFATIYFYNQQWNEALNWLQKLKKITSPLQDNKAIFAIAGLILRLMIHFEQANFELMRFHADATKEQIQELRRLTNYEKDIIKFFNYSKYHFRKELIAALSQQLNNYSENEDFQSLNDLLQFKKWLNLKQLEDQPVN